VNISLLKVSRDWMGTRETMTRQDCFGVYDVRALIIGKQDGIVLSFDAEEAKTECGYCRKQGL
jgi:hypothetical protein